VSEQEKVGGITSYEWFSVVLDPFYCRKGFIWCLRTFFLVGSTVHVFG
jgi:hypothetical protein